MQSDTINVLIHSKSNPALNDAGLAHNITFAKRQRFISSAIEFQEVFQKPFHILIIFNA